MPELPTLSPTDVSLHDHGWTCEPLDVETVLEEGETFAWDVAKVLRWLE